MEQDMTIKGTKATRINKSNLNEEQNYKNMGNKKK
jgi:hypothetical protein